MNWIKSNTVLKGELVELIPLEEIHFAELQDLAKEKKIWEFYPYDCENPTRFREILYLALKERDKGNQFPFVIFHKNENRIIGSTRLIEIEPQNRKLEIGWTWLHPKYWATAINLECKMLLLAFCFEYLKVIRVQLKTNEKNIRSQKAITKIGGKFEGILRHHMIADNGIFRNTAYYSIINTEWENAKKNLKELLQNKKQINATASK